MYEGMRHLCYVYIKSFRQLSDVEIKLDSRYNFEVNKADYSIKISKSSDIPKGFWGKGIYSVAAIVGDNGSGKTSILNFILESIVEGLVNPEINGVVVYEQGGELSVLGTNRIQADATIPCHGIDEKKNINCFYYSGHYRSYGLAVGPMDYQYAGSYIATDSWLLNNSLEGYSNDGLSPRLTRQYYMYQDAFISQNNHRICMMLAREDLRQILKGFSLPRYVIVGVNQGAETYFKNNPPKDKENKDIAIPPFKSPYQGLKSNDSILCQMVYNCLLSVIHDWGAFDGDFSIIEHWQDYLSDRIGVLPQLQEFANGFNEPKDRDYIRHIVRVLTRVAELTTFKTNGVTAFMYVDVINGSDALSELATILKNDGLLTSRLFDLYYAQSLDSTTILSSGEQELLDLFSRLYDAIELKPNKFGNLEASRIVLLDEAEIGYHPEWQRNYLSTVIKFLQAMYVIGGLDFQIVITTHSPILLSDIPTQCVNYLRKDANGKTYNVKSCPQTFGTNVFEQYRNSFFMENGLIGQFAVEKLNNIRLRLESNELDGIEREIELIGDERIRNFLMMRLKGNALDNEIRRTEARLEKLKELKRREQN